MAQGSGQQYSGHFLCRHNVDALPWCNPVSAFHSSILLHGVASPTQQPLSGCSLYFCRINSVVFRQQEYCLLDDERPGNLGLRLWSTPCEHFSLMLCWPEISGTTDISAAGHNMDASVLVQCVVSPLCFMAASLLCDDPGLLRSLHQPD